MPTDPHPAALPPPTPLVWLCAIAVGLAMSVVAAQADRPDSARPAQPQPAAAPR